MQRDIEPRGRGKDFVQGDERREVDGLLACLLAGPLGSPNNGGEGCLLTGRGRERGTNEVPSLLARPFPLPRLLRDTISLSLSFLPSPHLLARSLAQSISPPTQVDTLFALPSPVPPVQS